MIFSKGCDINGRDFDVIKKLLYNLKYFARNTLRMCILCAHEIRNVDHSTVHRMIRIWNQFDNKKKSFYCTSKCKPLCSHSSLVVSIYGCIWGRRQWKWKWKSGCCCVERLMIGGLHCHSARYLWQSALSLSRSLVFLRPLGSFHSQLWLPVSRSLATQSKLGLWHVMAIILLFKY